MKITFVGSSHGVPEAHRKCTCIMLEVGDNVYFIDMGTSAIDALRTRGIDIDKVKGVFVTHMHGDHTNGLIQFVDLITWYFKTPDPVICLPVPEAAKVIDAWLEVTLNGAKKDIQYRETQSGVVFDDGVLKVTAKGKPSSSPVILRIRVSISRISAAEPSISWCASRHIFRPRIICLFLKIMLSGRFALRIISNRSCRVSSLCAIH